ncbi:3288_t:CDS:10 [Ambispora gerdemannii]|uniref:3288_t:CDS:1 n=1 Tax=Ambispora gerdemannii TaxID=144530 RepID=A0A9N8WKI3_9GLOM|nr:3288_t:CDS:10 [Ambispora gerdemannii]
MSITLETLIWFQVEGRDVNNVATFPGSTFLDLRKAIKAESKLTYNASSLVLRAKKDDPDVFKKDCQRSFSKLIDIGVDEDNPIKRDSLSVSLTRNDVIYRSSDNKMLDQQNLFVELERLFQNETEKQLTEKEENDVLSYFTVNKERHAAAALSSLHILSTDDPGTGKSRNANEFTRRDGNRIMAPAYDRMNPTLILLLILQLLREKMKLHDIIGTYEPPDPLNVVPCIFVIPVCTSTIAGPVEEDSRIPVFKNDGIASTLVEDCGGHGRVLEDLNDCLAGRLNLSENYCDAIFGSVRDARPIAISHEQGDPILRDWEFVDYGEQRALLNPVSLLQAKSWQKPQQLEIARHQTDTNLKISLQANRISAGYREFERNSPIQTDGKTDHSKDIPTRA